MSCVCMSAWCEKFTLTNNETAGTGCLVVIDVFFARYDLGVQILNVLLGACLALQEAACICPTAINSI